MRKSLILKLLLFLIPLVGCSNKHYFDRRMVESQDHLLNGDPDAAIQSLLSIINISQSGEDQARVLFSLAQIFFLEKNRPQLATHYLDKILDLELSPIWQVKVLEKIGEIHFEFTKQYQRSFSSYKRLYEFRPKLEKSDFYQFRMGMSLYNLATQKPEVRKDSFRIFIDITNDPNHRFYLSSYEVLGEMEYSAQNWEQAIFWWKKYLVYESNQSKVIKVRFLIANCYEMKGDLRSAYNLYYSIMKDYPNSKVAKERLEAVYRRRVARKR